MRFPTGRYDAPEQPWAKAFEREIYIKENAAWLLEQELGRIDPTQEIALGTATDPYQPIERRAGLTRSVLDVFSRRAGYKLGIITKSNLITRDIDLLTRIAERHTLVVHITITTTDAGLARKLEPRAPRPDLRFAAVRQLRDAGITTGILCSPLLPGINDAEASVDRVAKSAALARASFLAAHSLFSQVLLPSYLAELCARALPPSHRRLRPTLCGGGLRGRRLPPAHGGDAPQGL